MRISENQHISEPKKIKIIIADDHEVFRVGLKILFMDQPDFQVAAEADDGKTLISALKNAKADIVLTDINMPKLDGIAASRLINKEFPGIGIIGISRSNEIYRVNHMIEAGAKGYLLKSVKKEEIFNAITEVYNHQNYFCRATTTALVNNSSSLLTVGKGGKPQSSRLSDKEIRIIKLICDEYSAKEISNEFFQSCRTVEGWRLKILEKLNVKNTAGIVKYAIRNGIYLLN
jgi:DNA-binding NarL/FixJ family response regulator